MMILRKIIAAVAISAACHSAAHAQSEAVLEAQLASEALRSAAAGLNEAGSAKDRVKALTNTVRAYEDGLSAMRDGLRGATIRERVIRLEFESRRDQLSRLLGILQTLERATTPMLLIHPTGPVGTARSGMMMSEVTPSLQRQAEELKSQLEELSELRRIQTEAEEQLRLGLAGVQEARVSLSQAIADRTDLPRRLTDDPVKTQILADSATSLEMFAGSIGVLPPEPETAKAIAFEKKRGTLRLPVDGAVLRGFNEVDAAGLKRPGLVIAARPLALVSAPAASTIRYAGAFLDYGNVIVLEPQPKYLLVIAGLNQVYGEIGEVVDQDAPVGLLGGTPAGAQEFLIEASDGGSALAQETLYIELRYEGEPVDPSVWFAVNDS
ncbi:peptidoglycan DD-metalloendopeptidase family protein [Amylibacter sp. IMCC11727]|uniref:murein hydrolase activator EnvC family protein n=1 Tax=Amylibacter sp. IMCC11727 TaxID=3039851 RepID=UPI00244DE4B6|nr:peptidoglycan DD-metalloendopeptidase family protein [Amylibacter sp. IMCC11727]WGI21959.1 peptidoglycan DD-metalloendopeptidase family protein [Amylibacter sp. IMCC11727]